MAKQTNITIADVLAFINVNDEHHYTPKDSGVTTTIPTKRIFTEHPEMLRYALLAGMFGKLGNVSKGGLSKALGRDATDKDLAKARDSIVQNWLESGTWNARGGGERDSLVAFMWDALFAERGASTSAAQAKVRKEAAKLVTDTFGDKHPATFGNFLDAVAKSLAASRGEDVAELRDRLERKYRDKALALRTASAEAASSIDLGGMLD